MFTVMGIIIGAAFVTTIATAMGKCPVWVPLVLLCIFGALQVFPLR